MVANSQKAHVSNDDHLKRLLSTPTSNFGLAHLFRKFVLLGTGAQVDEVSSDM